MKGSAFVTGATGCLGQALVKGLTTRGRHVVALVRQAGNPLGLPPGAAPDYVHGDLEDTRRFRSRLPRGGTVFHLAAVRAEPGTSPEALDRVNVRATLSLARAAIEAEVFRFIHVSTAHVFGPSFERARTEADGYADPRGRSRYVATRIEAARGLRALVDEGLPLVIVSPTIIYGADPPLHPNRVTSHLRRLRRSRWDLVIGGGRRRRDLVHLTDVVRAIFAAEEHGAVGEEYIVGGEAASHRELNRRFRNLSGRRAWVSVSLPRPLASVAARLLDGACGRAPESGLTAAVANLSSEWRFSSEKARRQLNHRPLPLTDGLTRTLHFLNGDPDHA
jgi:nucleoside-diphosphate-sugar epimerase